VREELNNETLFREYDFLQWGLGSLARMQNSLQSTLSSIFQAKKELVAQINEVGLQLIRDSRRSQFSSSHITGADSSRNPPTEALLFKGYAENTLTPSKLEFLRSQQ
jgi:hypothetical protein